MNKFASKLLPFVMKDVDSVLSVFDKGIAKLESVAALHTHKADSLQELQCKIEIERQAAVAEAKRAVEVAGNFKRLLGKE